MEDNEDAESTKSEVKLGKLQFSLDYDFQKGEVLYLCSDWLIGKTIPCSDWSGRSTL